MRYQQHNDANMQKRLALCYKAWTKVYTLFKVSTEISAPVFSRRLLESCSFDVSTSKESPRPSPAGGPSDAPIFHDMVPRRRRRAGRWP